MGFRGTQFLPVETTYDGGTSSAVLTSEPVVGGSSGNPEPPTYLGPEIRLAVEGGGGTSWVEVRSSDGVDFITVDPSDNEESRPEDRLRLARGVLKPVGRDWAAVPLVNSWAPSGGQTPRMLVDAAGRLEVHGRVAAGTTGIVAELGADLAPAHLMDFVCKANNDASTISWVQVSPAGRITVVSNVAGAQVQLCLSTLAWSTLP